MSESNLKRSNSTAISMAIAVAMFFASIPAMAAPLVTLQQIIEKTVTSNPEVQARYHNFTAAEQETLVSRGGLLPKLDVTTNFRRQESIGDNIGNTNIPERQTALVLRQMLFDGFITANQVNQLTHTSRVRYYELQSAMHNIALEAARAYLDIQRYRQLTIYAQDNYVYHKQFYDRIEERVLAGVGRRVDLEQASGRLALAEANLLTETSNLHDVIARYQRLVGELPQDTLPEVNFAPLGVSATATEALELAYRQNPELLAAIENIVATENEVKGRRGSYMPRLDLQARKVLETSSDGRNSTQAADVLELTLNFNLFNGLSDRSAINQAVEKLISTQDLRDKACIDTRQVLVIAYNDIERLKEQLVYRDQHQLSIEKAREAYRKQFDIGQRTLLDLLDTENEYFQARRAYANTEYDLKLAYARTFTAQGELLNKLGVVRAGLPEYARAEYFDRQNVCQAVAPSVFKVDKKELLANARPLGDSLAMLKTPELTNPLSPESAVIARLNGRAKAWQDRNLEAYLAYYAEDFIPANGVTKAAWLKQRSERIKNAGRADVALRIDKVIISGNQATAKVTELPVVSAAVAQDIKQYEISKELQLKLVSNKWLIVSETVID